MSINTEWFMERIKDRHESLRKFSQMMVGRNGKKMDVSALSLTLNGKREMRIDEAKQIAKLLNVPFLEVIVQATGPIE